MHNEDPDDPYTWFFDPEEDEPKPGMSKLGLANALGLAYLVLFLLVVASLAL